MSAHNLPYQSSNADWKIADPGSGKAIPRSQSGCIPLVIAGTETNTLADPFVPGLWLLISVYSLSSGSRAITAATALNQAGNTVMTFADAGDLVELVSESYASNTNKCRWRIVANDGVALS